MIWLMALAILLTASSLALGDDDHEDHDWRPYRKHRYAPAPIQLISKDAYAAHCGGCHTHYPPELLPAHSWATLISKIATNNNMHFGTKVPLTEQERNGVITYLVTQSASTSAKAIASKIMRSLRYDQAPLRITDTPYFINTHRHIFKLNIKDKPVIKPSNCSACHKQAENGIFTLPESTDALNTDNFTKRTNSRKMFLD